MRLFRIFVSIIFVPRLLPTIFLFVFHVRVPYGGSILLFQLVPRVWLIVIMSCLRFTLIVRSIYSIFSFRTFVHVLGSYCWYHCFVIARYFQLF